MYIIYGPQFLNCKWIRNLSYHGYDVVGTRQSASLTVLMLSMFVSHPPQLQSKNRYGTFEDGNA